MKVYLAGTISGQSKEASTEWRDYAKSKLDDVDIKGFSPMRGHSYGKAPYAMTEDEKEMYLGRNMDSLVGINVRDYNDVKTADAILVNILNAPKVSIGTVMEIAWARAFQIPVIIVMEAGNVHDHGMLTFGNVIVPDLNEGIAAVIQILKP